MMAEEILTLKEVAVYLKLAEKTAYKLAAEGKLPGFKVGGSWRFKQADMAFWIEQQKQKASNRNRLFHGLVSEKKMMMLT